MMSVDALQLSIGQHVSISKIDHAGAVRITYDGQVLCANAIEVVVQCPWPAQHVVDLGGLIIEPGDQFLEYYLLGEWFNIFAIYSADGYLKGWYCNVTRPVEITGDAILWYDLVLDLLVLPDMQMTVLDEDELQSLDLDQEIVQQIRAALNQLCRWVEDRGLPLGHLGNLADVAKELALCGANETHQPAPLKHILVLRVPRPIEVRIEDTYLTLAGATKPIMGYHITLLGPFYPMSGRESAILGRIAEVCANYQAPEIHLSGLEAFRRPDDNTIYLSAEHSEDLLALQSALQLALHDQIVYWTEQAIEWNTDAYRPHVTLGLSLTDDELRRFMSLGMGRELQDMFTPERVCLFQETPVGAWQLVAHFAFQDAAELSSFDPHCP